jgi:DNA-binding NarL/FixJ family response regulator
MDGYAFVRQLRSAPSTDLIPVVFLTARDETSDRIQGFRSGVDAYLTKPFEPAELVAVIRGILGRVERTHSKIARLVGSAGQDERFRCRDEELTGAEELVATEVARGLSNKEIAAGLGISVRTVENHVSHILSKKHFVNRVELTRYVVERKTPE